MFNKHSVTTQDFGYRFLCKEQKSSEYVGKISDPYPSQRKTGVGHFKSMCGKVIALGGPGWYSGQSRRLLRKGTPDRIPDKVKSKNRRTKKNQPGMRRKVVKIL